LIRELAVSAAPRNSPTGQLECPSAGRWHYCGASHQA